MGTIIKEQQKMAIWSVYKQKLVKLKKKDPTNMILNHQEIFY